MAELTSERVPIGEEPKPKTPRGRPKGIRGRSKAGLTGQQAKSGNLQLRMDKVAKAHSANRPARVALSTQFRLSFPEAVDRDVWYYRVFSDRQGHIQSAKAAYYDHVTDSAGNNITRQGGPHKQYLMKIPMKYRLEDLKLKDSKILGTIVKEQQDIAPDEYLPDGRQHVIEKDDYDPTNPLA